MSPRKIALLLAIVLWPALAQSQSAPVALESPNGQLVITFQIVTGDESAAGAGQLVYDVSFEGKPLVEKSGLSVTLDEQPPLGSLVRIVSAEHSDADATYHLINGKASEVRNHYNALRLELLEDGARGRHLAVEARAYDDAVAFRYIVPAQNGMRQADITSENTEFRVAKDAVTYSLLLPGFTSQYESEYVRLNISALGHQGGSATHQLVGLPMLMHVPGVAWMAIDEADMRGYAAMYLENGGFGWNDHWLRSILAPHPDAPADAVIGPLPLHSPWRVMIAGDEPGRILESNALTSLNPESAINDTSWIHPGKAAWDWWGDDIGADGKSSFSTATMEFYTDFAAASGFPYMLVDAGWSPREDITQMNGSVDIPALVKYAAAKNVKVWIWLDHNATDRQMDEAFPLYEKWGVVGVKVDFVCGDDQQKEEFYFRTAETAAKYHLMVDFHGATTPTGLERTYPNVLGYEGILGMEQNKAGARDNPDHRLTIAFTRALSGPMDYTPGGFDNVTEDDFVPGAAPPMVMGTRAQQLAMYVVYYVPFEMVSDHPSAYAGQPEFQFIKDVPTVWDETRVLNGLPREFITVARRSGSDWFLGSMTNWTPRDLDVPLDFLGSGNYTAEIYADGPDADKNPKHVVLSTQTVDATSHLAIHLAPGGGYAVRFTPVK
jgi:alpha-glucosidase